jgi:NAD+ synthase (glutamine-hydrolysing)
MTLIKVAAGVLNQTPRDWNGNLANVLEAIRQAQEQKVSILCLPEMCITGYGLEDDYFCLDVSRRAILKLKEICPHTVGLIVNVGLPIVFDNTLYNTTAIIIDRKVVGFRCKESLANDGIHYESRWFKPWPKGVSQTIDIPELGGTFPIGDIHFDIGGVKIGLELCEEAWGSNRPGNILATKGVDIYLNPSASHFSFNKLNTRKNFVVDGSRAFSATYVYTNLVGNEAGRAIYDGGALIASGGTLVASGPRFSYKNVGLTTAVVDVDTTKTSQVRTASFQPDLAKYNEGCHHVPFNFPKIFEKLTTLSPVETWEQSDTVKHEECTRALGIALMDYMRKSRTKGFVVSLSGGADSAMVTHACVMGIKLGVEEIGTKAFIEKFCPHLVNCNYSVSASENAKELTVRRLIKNLITTAYQSTENSGEVTKTAAREVAKALNVKHYEFDVQPMFDCYKQIGRIVRGKDLNFTDNDLALQNLQARVRSPGIWVIANMESKLLLTTSNMSEAAVGYGTMNGDISGGICPIGGLPKTYIREYLRYLEDSGVCPEMSYVNKQAPTAELRPSQYKQTDEDDLMPYDLLHSIEVMCMQNRYTPLEIFKLLDMDKKYDRLQLMNYLIKFFRLFCQNQWKRECMPMGFHFDDHNLDPRSWARLPVLNSGYKDELEELVDYVNNS